MRGAVSRRAFGGAWLLACIAACASPHPAQPSESATPARSASAAASANPSKAGAIESDATANASGASRSAPWQGASSVTSNAGAYRVMYRASPAPIPRGDPFALDVWIFDARDLDRPLAGVALSVDAAMPEHQHGMNRRASVRALDAGAFHADGLLFHMPGRWEIYFDVTRGAITERAQARVELP
jgi:hypothetical protein